MIPAKVWCAKHAILCGRAIQFSVLPGTPELMSPTSPVRLRFAGAHRFSLLTAVLDNVGVLATGVQ